LIAQSVEHCIGIPVQVYDHSCIRLDNAHLSLCPDPSPPLTTVLLRITTSSLDPEDGGTGRRAFKLYNPH